MWVCLHKVHIHKARRNVPRGTQYRKLNALTKKYTPLVSLDLARGIKTFKKKIDKDALAAAWKNHHFADIMKIIPWQSLDEDLAPAMNRLKKSTLDAGVFSFDALPSPTAKALRWDMANPHLQDYVKNTSARTISGIEADTRDTVRDVITRSFNRAMTPNQVADQIEGSIGLFPKWEKAVHNFRSSLEEEGTHSDDRIDKLTSDYRDRLVRSRAMTIARSETRRATNFGQLAVWREALNEGLISHENSQRVYIVDGDPCDICDPMDGKKIGLHEHWVMPDGRSIAVAGDAHPNCMCTESIELE